MFVIILAPPDFPLPFDLIASRIFQQLLPIKIPFSGSSSILSSKSENSVLRDGYFLTNRFSCLSNGGIVRIS